MNQNRTIVLNFSEQMYNSFMESQEIAHQMIKTHYKQYSELFPVKMENDYMLNGKTRVSKKLGIQMRKIKVAGITYQIRPSFVLSYCRAKHRKYQVTLFLLKFGVPFWALADVFGKMNLLLVRLFQDGLSTKLVGLIQQYKKIGVVVNS